MPIEARQWIRKMRGGAQAHLLLADDGHYYVVKFKQNPQHRRILVNEWVASVLLRRLEIPTPAVEIVNVPLQFLDKHPEIAITIGSRVEPVTAGWHFGSRMPVDPNRFVIYDFLPDALLQQVANLRDFLGVLVFDKWVNNVDSRQCVFFRAQVKDWIVGQERSRKNAFVALMMDHGYIFGGPHWSLEEAPLTGFYARPLVYAGVRGLDSFQPWLDQIVHAPEELLDDAFRVVPDYWLNGDRELLEQTLEKLYRRRKRLPALLEDARESGRVNVFPNWVTP